MDRRWGVAVHEAGHVEVARSLGATGLTAHVDESGAGRFDGMFDGSDEDEAVILLAGAEAGRLIAGSPHGGAEDLADARRLLRGTGMSLGQAQRQARGLVRRNRGAIVRGARGLAG